MKKMKIVFMKLKYLLTKLATLFFSFLLSLLFVLSFLAITTFLIFIINADAPAASTHSASTRNISLSRDYEFVFFYSTTCRHCMKFEPILEKYSNNTGIKVRVFVVGEGKSDYFPNSTIVTQEIIEQFFGSFNSSNSSGSSDFSDSFKKDSSISVPTLFIINKNNLHAYPVSHGALTYSELYIRMNELIPKIIQDERNKRNERNEGGNNYE